MQKTSNFIRNYVKSIRGTGMKDEGDGKEGRRDLHWLHVPERVWFKVATLV
jgi:hypothetical protein